MIASTKRRFSSLEIVVSLLLLFSLGFWSYEQFFSAPGKPPLSLHGWVAQGEIRAQRLTREGKRIDRLPPMQTYRPVSFHPKKDPFHSFVISVPKEQSLAPVAFHRHAPLARRYPLSAFHLVGFIGSGIARDRAVCILPNGNSLLLHVGEIVGRRPNRVLEVHPQLLGRGYVLVRHPYARIAGKIQVHIVKIRQN
jgi:Tfp pilus assembly protein PilP